jgi:hypothetical protein
MVNPVPANIAAFDPSISRRSASPPEPGEYESAAALAEHLYARPAQRMQGGVSPTWSGPAQNTPLHERAQERRSRDALAPAVVHDETCVSQRIFPSRGPPSSDARASHLGYQLGYEPQYLEGPHFHVATQAELQYPAALSFAAAGAASGAQALAGGGLGQGAQALRGGGLGQGTQAFTGGDPRAGPHAFVGGVPVRGAQPFPAGGPAPLPQAFPSGNPTPLPQAFPSGAPTALPQAFPSGGPTALSQSFPSGAPTPLPQTFAAATGALGFQTYGPESSGVSGLTGANSSHLQDSGYNHRQSPPRSNGYQRF